MNIPLPRALDIEVTTRCNLNCIFCQVNKPDWKRSKIPDLSIERFKQIIDQFPHLDKVKLQGMGEPLLNKDILQMIAYSFDRGIKVKFTTNGTIYREGLFEHHPDLITFSIDSIKHFSEIRGKDVLPKILDNIRKYVKDRVRFHANTELRIWAVLTSKNCNELNDLIKLTHDLGLDTFTVQTRLLTFENDRLKISNRELEDYEFDEESFLEVAKSIGQNVNIFKENFYNESKKCPFIYETPYISVEGEVVPCCIIANPDVITMGNLFKDSFSEIWNNDKYTDFRRRHIRNDIPGICEACYQ
jgi:pyrroloquinoline quinone biosynthesis protein E